jgi:CHAT domain-containing protein
MGFFKKLIMFSLFIPLFLPSCTFYNLYKHANETEDSLEFSKVWEVEVGLGNPSDKTFAAEKRKQLEKKLPRVKEQGNLESTMVYAYQLAWLNLKKFHNYQRALALSEESLETLKSIHGKGLEDVPPTISGDSLPKNMTRADWYNHGKKKILSLILESLVSLNREEDITRFEKKAGKIHFTASNEEAEGVRRAKLGDMKNLDNILKNRNQKKASKLLTRIEKKIEDRAVLKKRIVNAAMDNKMEEVKKYEQDLIKSYLNDSSMKSDLPSDYFSIAIELKFHGNRRMALEYFLKQYQFVLKRPEDIYKLKNVNKENIKKLLWLHNNNLLYTELNIAREYKAIGNFPQSRAYYIKLLKGLVLISGANARSVNLGSYENLDLLDLYIEVGMVCGKSGDIEMMIRFFQRANDLIEDARTNLSHDDFKIGYASRQSQVYIQIIETLIDRNCIDQALIFVEKSKSRALLDLLSSTPDTGKMLNQGQEVRNITASRNALSEAKIQLVLNGINEAGQDERLRAIKINKKNIMSKRKQLMRQNPKLSMIVDSDIDNINEFVGYLDDKTALIEYFIGKENLYIWIVSRSGIQFHMQKIKDMNLSNLIDTFVKSITYDIQELEEYSSNALYSLLIMPILQHLKAYKLLCVIPHSILHQVPFHALKNNGKYLLEDFPIYYLSSAGAMKYWAKQRQGSLNSIVVFGNPSLSEPDMNLPYAEAEAVKIASLFDSNSLFVRDRATKENFLKNLNSHDIIHIAAHGVFNQELPMQSQLLLADGLQGKGAVTANDILHSDLSGTQLATLSACETSRSKVTSGDELIGFNRSFMAAGCPSVVSSLWNVSDESTAELMTEFYSNLKYMNKVDALRKSQLKLLHSGVFKRPFFWAPFILVGDPR